MKRSFLVGFLGLGLMVATTTDAQAQLTNMPTQAVPSGAPRSIFVAGYGRGLNEMSGKQNAFMVGYARTGIADRVGTSAGGWMGA